MEKTRKHSGIVLLGTAHLDGHIDSEDHECIEFILAGDIFMNQVRIDRNGKIHENEIKITTKWQAKAVIQIIKAMSAANGWKV
jgi:hypothetical protein